MAAARWFLLAAACLGCAGGTQEDTAPPKIASTWQGDTAMFTWTWNTEVDAFNMVVIRDGNHEPQTEISGDSRSVNVPTNGATTIGIALQACSKGFLSSSCTDWTEADATR